MPARDYKDARSSRPRQPPRRPPRHPSQGSWLSFVSGLGTGLVLSLALYLWGAHLPLAQLRSALGITSQEENRTPERVTSVESSSAARENLLPIPSPKFDFYKILPEIEVPVPDWELPEDTSSTEPAEPAENNGAYMLQVGSFKHFGDADSVKARLALIGITANIQRVVINGQDVWFRVHVGPMSDERAVRNTRLKLVENDLDFILLRIGGATGE